MNASRWRALAAAALWLLVPALPTAAQEPQTFPVTSVAMATGEYMPRDYSPDGRNLSPPLSWTDLPAGTEQLAVVCADFGAGNPPPWVHWIIYNIPASADGLPEGLPIDPDQPMPAGLEGAVHGANGWGRENWRGPAPPGTSIHHYNFSVYALSRRLDLPAGLTREEMLAEIAPYVIGRGVMIPMYTRQPMNRATEQH